MTTHDWLYKIGYNDPTPAGVYALVDVRTGKLYVGSTVNLSRRASQHFRMLEEGTHFNRNLQYTWDLSGPSSFSFVVLERSEEAELVDREQRWLNRLHRQALNIQHKVSRPEWEDWKPVDNVILPWEDSSE